MKRHNMATGALAGVAIAVFVSVQAAASSITVDSVAQRWPWNNKLDITYTVTGGQDLVASNFCRIVFSTIIGGTTYTIDGVKDVGASANAGTHTVTWTAPSGLKCDNCTMSASVYASDAPSGNDYMIVDLTKSTDNVTFEGLLANQSESNRRYNTDDFKQTKMAFRKVPAGQHKTATDHTGATMKTWTTDRDYYIGVFPITVYQYLTITGGSGTKTKKVQGVNWNTLRVEGTSPLEPVPAVNSNSGTFIQRLNYITGNKFNFDLPTEVMWEIAIRAGSETHYYWGNTYESGYANVNKEYGGLTEVGGLIPNSWGLYDMAGQLYEWTLDAYETDSSFKQQNAADAFTPQMQGNCRYRATRGGHYSDGVGYAQSSKLYGMGPTGGNRCGRLAWIAE